MILASMLAHIGHRVKRGDEVDVFSCSPTVGVRLQPEIGDRLPLARSFAQVATSEAGQEIKRLPLAVSTQDPLALLPKVTDLACLLRGHAGLPPLLQKVRGSPPEVDDVIKEERMPDGSAKVILKDRDTGEIMERIV